MSTDSIVLIGNYILITGDRNWDDVQMIRNMFAQLLKSHPPSNFTVIEGDCRGADRIAGSIAFQLGYQVKKFPADWNKGPNQGPIRNTEMVNLYPAVVLIYHNNLKASKGTKDCVRKVKDLPYFPIVYHNNELIPTFEKLSQL